MDLNEKLIDEFCCSMAMNMKREVSAFVRDYCTATRISELERKPYDEFYDYVTGINTVAEVLGVRVEVLESELDENETPFLVKSGKRYYSPTQISSMLLEGKILSGIGIDVKDKVIRLMNH